MAASRMPEKKSIQINREIYLIFDKTVIRGFVKHLFHRRNSIVSLNKLGGRTTQSGHSFTTHLVTCLGHVLLINISKSHNIHFDTSKLFTIQQSNFS